MKASGLVPKPKSWETFEASSTKFIPSVPGCYVCSDGYEAILYIGRSETSIRSRFEKHLERNDMNGVIYFHWLEAKDTDIRVERLEQKWVELHEMEEGVKPKLNKIAPSL